MKPIVAVLAMSLAACAGPQLVWVHPSKPPQQFYADSAECMQFANANAPRPSYVPEPAIERRPSGVVDAYQQGYTKAQNQRLAEQAEADRRTMYDHCVRGRGWYTVAK